MTPTTIDALFDRIIRQGVQVCCLGAGSRSTQLVHLLQQTHVELMPFVDERAVGYMALGIAKATKRPVLVVTTSGTAVSNLCPAMAEAANGHINLIALTATDPAIRQAHRRIKPLINRAFFTMPWLRCSEAGRDVCDECDRAFDLMARQGGPVHVNVRLNDPVTHPLTEWASVPPRATQKQLNRPWEPRCLI